MSKLLKDLEAKIKEESQKYYSKGSNTITDEQFDALVDTVEELDPNSDVLSISWGYDVDKDSTSGEKVKHRCGLVGSLDKYRNIDDMLKRFDSPTQLYYSLKLDGLSIVLYYESGKLVDAVTRGDGYTGISIYDKIRFIDRQLFVLPVNFTGAIRGEILMTIDNFDTFKYINQDAKNPRNAAAGLVNRKDKYEDLKFLDIIVYTVVKVSNEYEHIVLNNSTMYNFLNRYFSYVVPYKKISEDSFDTLNSQFKCFKTKWVRLLPIDGIVVSAGLELDNNTGNVSYDSVAFKFESESKAVEVIDVEYDMSKTHYAIPRVKVTPVQLSGATVEYAAGHNAQYILDNDIGPGAIVELTRSGEVIPYIKSVIEPTIPKVIKNCPICNSVLSWNGVHLQCKNSNCDNAIVQDTLVWINTLAPLDNFGDTLRLKYLSMYLEDISIESIMDGSILKFIDKPTELVQDTLFYKFIHLLYENPISLESAIISLNIPRFSTMNSAKLANYPDIVKRLIAVSNEEQKVDSLLDIYGYIGDANSDSLIENIHKFKRLNLIRDRIVWSNSESKGKVAITGKLSVKRSQFNDELRQFGYILVSSVTQDVMYLITDNPNSSSSKNLQADNYGITKITESQFRKQFMSSEE
jgi:DNA ligase (NAD+)